MAPKKELLKGPLRPPEAQLRPTSYTQKPASKNEVSVRTGKEAKISVTEFSFQTPKPFLDPSILQRRIQAGNQWKAEQEKKQRLEGGPSQGT
ncbi:hypothetical protein NA56DRAFT_704133 [Hyaloscypha hepaticicola]|uniref:Uncharacterized protein n=1 Tax=Hyaloscypha hepaticicola TaxID=2082293 RepID=A0A2J6Q3S9_9HELO|nr:hypothetical protein NA56DRAFT_704133 [Hyaloscypha hepaticicola]